LLTAQKSSSLSILTLTFKALDTVFSSKSSKYSLNSSEVSGSVEVIVYVQRAVLPPSTVVAMMKVVPFPSPLTTPLAFTEAMEGSSLTHSTFLFVALAGVIEAVNVSVEPLLSSDVVLLKDMPLTGTLLTVTAQVAVWLPLVVVTLMFATPADSAVTTPLLLTEATAALSLLHVTVVIVALAGSIVRVNVSVAPTLRLVDVLFSVTPVTLMMGVTVTVHCAVWLPSSVVTVMTAVPADTALTKPLFAPFEVTLA
jgi:hypothetical protein